MYNLVAWFNILRQENFALHLLLGVLNDKTRQDRHKHKEDVYVYLIPNSDTTKPNVTLATNY